MGSNDLLWAPDARVWDAVAPILFPVVGWTQDRVIRVDGKTYPIGVHGFAAARTFRVIEAQADRLILGDDADNETRSVYPFDFGLRVCFELRETALACTVIVTNTGAGVMPYAIGLHPGFRWPVGSDGALTFQSAEETSVPTITPDGLFAAQRRRLPFDGHHLSLTRDLLTGEALCFLNTRSTRFTFSAARFGRLHLATRQLLPPCALDSPACAISVSGVLDRPR